jgi:hypothetical protein
MVPQMRSNGIRVKKPFVPYRTDSAHEFPPKPTEVTATPPRRVDNQSPHSQPFIVPQPRTPHTLSYKNTPLGRAVANLDRT